jgi:hypothetical protein
MKKAIASLLILVIIISFVFVLVGVNSFSFDDYISYVSTDIPPKPDFPSEPDWDSLSGLDKFGQGLAFIGGVIWYPFEYIFYLGQVGIHFFGSLGSL